MIRYVSVVAIAFLSIANAQGADSIETSGVVDAVTVYRGQALVTRKVEVPGPAGLREVIVTDLPAHIVAGSIYADSNDSVEIRSVRYRVRPLADDVREEVRKLDEQIREVHDQIQATVRHKQLMTEHKTYLDKLEQFVAPTATVELTKGVLNAETLKGLTTFLFAERARLADEELKLAIEERTLAERNDVLQRERHTLTGSSTRTAREAVVFLNLPKAEGGRLRLSYLVANANWSPSYNVRTDKDRGGALLEYFASIQQMSGEDWNDVSMTLSTATPSLVAKAPVLMPLSVTLAPLGQEQQLAQGGGKGGRGQSKDELAKQQRQVEMQRGNTLQAQQLQFDAAAPSAQAAGGNYDWILNDLACDLQMIDLLSHGKVTRTRERSSPAEVEGLSVTYELASRTTLPSRSDQQLVQIAALPLKGEFYRVASPVLTAYVYEEAQLTNATQTVLLAGPVSTYVAGQFVGHGDLPTVTAGEKFTVGLGIDSALRVERELLDRTESVQGGNRVVEFTYGLSIQNFRDEAVKVRLLDRLPRGKESEVNVNLASTSVDLSDDSEYQRLDRKKGILRWDVDVPANASLADARTVEYKFRVEYDKGTSISGLPIAMP